MTRSTNPVLALTIAMLVLATPRAVAGFQSPESVVRNVYAYYGNGSDDFSRGLPRDEDTARNFFDDSLQQTCTAIKPPPYDFFVQSPSWKPVSIAVTLKQFDRTYVAASFSNGGKPVTLNFIVVKRPEGWLIYDVESTHDSLRMFLRQLKE